MSVSSVFSLAKDSLIQHIGTRLVVSTSTATWGNTLIGPPRAGDFIYVQVSSPYTYAPQIATAGYTLIAENLSNTNYDSDTHSYYKISDGTETRVDFGSTNTTYGAIAFLSIFRGVDNTNPFDVPPVTAADAYYLQSSYRPVPDIYPVTSGALIIKSMHTVYAGDPTSVVFFTPNNSQVKLLKTYSYPTPSTKATAIIATTTYNEALKSFGAVPNINESLSTNFGASSIAVALRPA